ncbi:Alpha/beta hydrolase family [Carpediemonas membranifera]|uniref:Alpha/beta hydrolase family n=1 Tax=Carpediemonas membranifera TaxID=201153 RepID=A0A8J6AXK4_9EUKA|nr:Alpha/beta hydrolase family [Carpediemonas membranifera]|eukprot:KAG9390873.1 Alpha/beta hydrolase family [Carpediemonas membranifera]
MDASTPCPFDFDSNWPCEIVHINDNGRDVHLVTQSFQHERPLDRPTFICLPDIILDGRTSFQRFLSHPLLKPLFGLGNVVILNYPHAASPNDGETYDEPYREYPSFNHLSSLLQLVIGHITPPGHRILIGAGMGALLANHIATTAPDLVDGLIMVSPPPLREPMSEVIVSAVAENTMATESRTAVFPDYLRRRWMDRWFDQGCKRGLALTSLAEFESWFATRLPAHTFKFIRCYMNRPMFTPHVSCPTLVLEGTDTPVNLKMTDFTGIPDIVVVPINGRGLCHLERPRQCSLPLCLFVRTLMPSLTVPRNMLVAANHNVKTLLPVTFRAVLASVRLRTMAERARTSAIKGIDIDRRPWTMDTKTTDVLPDEQA